MIVMHTIGNMRQAKKAQLPSVFNAIERYEKRYGFVHMPWDMLKPTMSIDAPVEL